MQNFRGSAQVEAALIVPLVILIIIGMIKTSITLEEKVVASSAENCAAAELLSRGGKVPTESILRGRWYIK